MALTFTAVNESGEAAQAGENSSELAMTVAEGSTVTFTLQATGAITGPAIRRQATNESIGDVEVADDKLSATAAYTVSSFGTFTASATVGGSQVDADTTVTLVKESAPVSNLTFTAVNEADEAAKLGADGSVATLTVAEGAKVTFRLESPGDIDAPAITRQEDGTPIRSIEIAPDKKSATAAYTVSKFGTFTASATVSGSQVSAANGVKLVKGVPASPPPNGNGDNPSELAVGELDTRFAFVTLAVVVAVAVAIAWVVGFVVSRVDWPKAAQMVAEGQVVDGSFGQRAAFIVLLVGAAIGGVVLLIGAWLAAIETRGRLRAPIRTGDQAKGPGVAAAELDAIANILDKARRLRGSMAVVIAGALIMAIAIWGARPLTAADPEPTPTQTATPSVTPTAPETTPGTQEPTSSTPTPVPTATP